jgi:hypothetical protein
MAQTWTAKAAADVVERRWTVPLPECDALSSVSTSASGVTVDGTDTDGSDAVLTLSAGTAGTTGSVTVTVLTTEGLSLSETFLIPIRVTTAQLGNTARDICYFALRKIVGNGNDPTADELSDALERLNDMCALWAFRGVDIGLSEPLAAGDTLSVPDGFLSALKYNLRIGCHSHYGQEIDAFDSMMADQSYRALENALVQLGDVSMPRNLRRRLPYYSAEA